MRILICDDTDMIRMTLRKFLQKMGHDVVAECASGQDAIDKYSEVEPDVCVMDISMPGMDGITAYKKIKEQYPDAKAIMCTGQEDSAVTLETIQMGAVDCISKPFTPQRLTEALQKIH